MNILIFGGTTEGRVLARQLAEAGETVTVSCATELGGEELRGIPCRVRCGRLDTEKMTMLVSNYDLVADATHPYSLVVSANIRTACGQAGVPLRRILRTCSREQEGGSLVRDCRAAAELLRETEGNILLTTGSKELADYACLPPARIYPRILPTHEGLAACEAMGIPHRNILALQGPFSQKMNEATIEQYGIRWLATRNSGAAGGYREKLAAAQAQNVGIIVVQRPEETGLSMEAFLDEVKNNACEFTRHRL